MNQGDKMISGASRESRNYVSRVSQKTKMKPFPFSISNDHIDFQIRKNQIQTTVHILMLVTKGVTILNIF